MRRLALALVALSVGCEDLSDFDTAPGEAYCGTITLASVFRMGFSPRVQMRMRFDSSKIESGESPGTLTTFEAETDVPSLLSEAPLRPIAPLMHDPLSQLEFGGGRDRNLIYAVSPKDSAAESMLAVVSLRADDSVEVRLIRPGSATEQAVAGRQPLFGLFTLVRQEGDCGF